jgi:prepilin-type N-terminal cleavage/methylation domain-containing protein
MQTKNLGDKKNRLLTGFTIIELIVVIAIIAVLASIVLVNVTSYINKGKDAAAEGNLASLITNGAVWYDNSAGGVMGRIMVGLRA